MDPWTQRGGENKLICTNLTSGLLQGALGQAGEAGRRPQGWAHGSKLVVIRCPWLLVLFLRCDGLAKNKGVLQGCQHCCSQRLNTTHRSLLLFSFSLLCCKISPLVSSFFKPGRDLLTIFWSFDVRVSNRFPTVWPRPHPSCRWLKHMKFLTPDPLLVTVQTEVDARGLPICQGLGRRNIHVQLLPSLVLTLVVPHPWKREVSEATQQESSWSHQHNQESLLTLTHMLTSMQVMRLGTPELSPKASRIGWAASPRCWASTSGANKSLVLPSASHLVLHVGFSSQWMQLHTSPDVQRDKAPVWKVNERTVRNYMF